jgi:hypothetical protein
MSIVLQSSAGGQITIQEPATASNFTQTLPAASGEVMVSGNQPAFSAYAGSATALALNAFTKVLFDTEEFDTNNNFVSSRFQPTIAGYYQINSTVQGTAVTSILLTAILKNGIAHKYGGIASTGGGNSPLACVSSIVFLNGTIDYIEIFAFTGTAQNTSTGIAATYFNGCLVRAA